jgi:hypothetical protein
MTIRTLKRGFIVNSSKSRLGTIALILVALFAGTTPSQAAAAKPGTPVKATAADTLVVGKVGFSDKSYCYPVPLQGKSNSGCPNQEFLPTYITTWAFAVTNKSKTKSASQVRAQVTFFNATGTILLQTIVTVAREIKPGKVGYAASSITASDASITGVATATAKLVSPTWIVPSTKIYQTPISLNVTPGALDLSRCGIGEPCATRGNLSTEGAHTDISGVGDFTLRGPSANLSVVVVYLNMQGDPIGGWSGLTNYWYGNKNVWEFKTGSQQVTFNASMTKYLLANTATYLFVPQI